MSPIAALLGATPAVAQQPRVPVPVPIDGLRCSTASIMNLRNSDGFLAVRSGPSQRERELARLRNGDDVFACVRRGNWFGIVFEQPNRGLDCDAFGNDRETVLLPVRPTRPYSGPCRSGWVHYDYIGGYADWISP